MKAKYIGAIKDGWEHTILERYIRALESIGMQVTEIHEHTFEAEIETPSGKLTIYCGDNGCARIDKPNGTHKWLYEKSYSQIRRAVEQSLEFWMR